MTWTPDFQSAGTYNDVRIYASDGLRDSFVSFNVTVNPVHQAPQPGAGRTSLALSREGDELAPAVSATSAAEGPRRSPTARRTCRSARRSTRPAASSTGRPTSISTGPMRSRWSPMTACRRRRRRSTLAVLNVNGQVFFDPVPAVTAAAGQPLAIVIGGHDPNLPSDAPSSGARRQHGRHDPHTLGPYLHLLDPAKRRDVRPGQSDVQLDADCGNRPAPMPSRLPLPTTATAPALPPPPAQCCRTCWCRRSTQAARSRADYRHYDRSGSAAKHPGHGDCAVRRHHFPGRVGAACLRHFQRQRQRYLPSPARPRPRMWATTSSRSPRPTSASAASMGALAGQQSFEPDRVAVYAPPAAGNRSATRSRCSAPR